MSSESRKVSVRRYSLAAENLNVAARWRRHQAERMTSLTGAPSIAWIADERDAMRAMQRIRRAHGAGTHPLGTGAGLADAATAEHEPRAPGRACVGGSGRQLVVAGPTLPRAGEPCDLVVLERAERGDTRLSRQAG